MRISKYVAPLLPAAAVCAFLAGCLLVSRRPAPPAATPSAPASPAPQAEAPAKRAPAWPQFQGGPDRQGALDRPPIESPRVLWSALVGIQGYLNCPVIAGDRVFVTSSGESHNQPDPLDGVYCLDRQTGEVLWHRRTENDANGIALGAAAVYATGDDGRLQAFAIADGDELWAIRRPRKLYCQPLVLDDLVLVGDSDGTIVAADRDSGEIRWETRVGDTTVRGGLSSDGERIYAAFRLGPVVALDRAGREIWRQDLFENRVNEIYGAPTISGDRVIITYARDTFYNTPPVYALEAKTGTLLWQARDKDNNNFGNIRSSVACWNGLLLYGATYGSELIALQADDGTLAWQLPTGPAMFPHWPSPVAAGDLLYLPRHDGTLYAIDLPQQEVKWQLYLGRHDSVGPDAPEENLNFGGRHAAWDPPVGRPLYASPALDEEGSLYLGTGEGYLYAIGDSRRPPPSEPRP